MSSRDVCLEHANKLNAIGQEQMLNLLADNLAAIYGERPVILEGQKPDQTALTITGKTHICKVTHIVIVVRVIYIWVTILWTDCFIISPPY
jgi:hypothetical protein